MLGFKLIYPSERGPGGCRLVIQATRCMLSIRGFLTSEAIFIWEELHETWTLKILTDANFKS